MELLPAPTGCSSWGRASCLVGYRERRPNRHDDVGPHGRNPLPATQLPFGNYRHNSTQGVGRRGRRMARDRRKHCQGTFARTYNVYLDVINVGRSRHTCRRLLNTRTKGSTSTRLPIRSRQFSSQFRNFAGPTSMKVLLLFHRAFVFVIIKVVSRYPSGSKYRRGSTSRLTRVLHPLLPHVTRSNLKHQRAVEQRLRSGQHVISFRRGTTRGAYRSRYRRGTSNVSCWRRGTHVIQGRNTCRRWVSK